MENEPGNKKRVRDDSDEFENDDSPEVKRLREDLLEDIDDDDSELCNGSHDLDSFMRSFEEEIAASPSHQQVTEAVDLESESGSGHSRLDLGFLLEASDDELGLPPSNASPSEFESREKNELTRVVSDSSDLSDLWAFDDQIPSYDSLAFPVGENDCYSNGVGEYVALDGLFDYSDTSFGSADTVRRPETLSAQ